MISNPEDYEKARSDLRILEQRITDLERRHPIGDNGFTKASVRKLIAIMNADLAAYEAREDTRLHVPLGASDTDRA